MGAPPDRSRLNSVQSLRAIAAWVVVCHHFMQIFYNFQLPGVICRALHLYGSIGVDLFFVISGFVIQSSTSKKPMGPLAFARKRLLRIVPAYWLFTGATALVMVFTPIAVPFSQFELSLFVKSLFFVPAHNPSGVGIAPIMTVGWTLNFEMAFYMIFFVSLFLPERFRVGAVSALVICLQLSAFAIGGDFGFYKRFVMYDFLLGIAVAIVYERGAFQTSALRFSIASVVAALVVIFLFGATTHSPILRGIPCAFLLYAALLQEKRFPSHSLLTALGNWSYSTYLCHILIMAFVLEFSKNYGTSGLVSFAMIVVMVLATSCASFRLVEEPAQAIGRRKQIAALSPIS